MKYKWKVAVVLWMMTMVMAILFWDSALRVTEKEFIYKPYSSIFYCSEKHGYYSCSYPLYSSRFLHQLPSNVFLAITTPFTAIETLSCWKECNGGIQSMKPILLATPYVWIPFWYALFSFLERRKKESNVSIDIAKES